MSVLWRLKPQVELVDRPSSLPEPLLQILAQRGVTSQEDIESFLKPETIKLPHPSKLPDGEIAIQRIVRAIRNGERICIYADYDPDGHCSNAQMRLALRYLGVPDDRVFTRIPAHDKEGYGLNLPAVEEIAAQGCDLLIALDCGITSHAEIARANELGMDVIVIDHHEPDGETLPPALAVVDPKRRDIDPEQRWEPCAAGLVYVVLWGLFMALGRTGYEDRIFLNQLVDLAGLGTIADMVPLLGPNRRLAAAGLKMINKRLRAPIRALIKASNLDVDANGLPRVLTAYDVGMRLAPKINAGRRMDDSEKAAQLLLEQDESKALLLAQELVALNEMRRGETERAVLDAQAQVDPAKRVLVVVGYDWRKGVVGLVAQRLMKDYHRPVFAMTLGDDGLFTGSCRGIPGTNVHELLMACSDLLEKAGGHELAGGFTIRRENIPAFEQRLQELASRYSDELFVPVVEIDVRCSVSSAAQLLNYLPLLEPCGEGNPAPRIWIRGSVIESRVFGRDPERQHIELTLQDSGPGRHEPLKLIGWGLANDYLTVQQEANGTIDVLTRWNGNGGLVIEALRAATS